MNLDDASTCHPDNNPNTHQFNGGSTIVSVLMHIIGSYEGTPVEQDIRFTRVWAISASGSIQIIAGHTSAIPPQQS